MTAPQIDAVGFREALGRRLDAIGRSQTWVAWEVAREMGRDEPYSQATVSDWISGRRGMAPEQVFAIERVLELEPGALSRLLGYLPADAVATVTVEDAIRADPTLSSQHRDAVLALYRALSDPGKES